MAGTHNASTDPVSRDESLLTYRSGAKYESELQKEGTQQMLGPIYDDSSALSHGDKGHIFEHSFLSAGTSHGRQTLRQGDWSYTGPLFMFPSNLRPRFIEHDLISGYSTGELDVLGAEAISQTYPTKPSADLLVAIAEIMREGLPTQLFSAIASTKGNSKRDLVRSLSSDYLSYLFGFTPVVKEVDKLIKTINKMDQKLAQLDRDSGKLVRRSRVLVKPEVKDVSTEFVNTRVNLSSNVSCPSLTHFAARESLPVKIKRTLVREATFAAAFQYWTPDMTSLMLDNESRTQIAKARTLMRSDQLGLRATPKAAWNLIGFSWLIDWFVNVSVLFENADAMTKYGLVMPYGYVMGESKLTTTVTVDLAGTSQASLGTVATTWIDTHQLRTRATPYGFGLKETDFNPIQWSILAALGLKLVPPKRS